MVQAIVPRRPLAHLPVPFLLSLVCALSFSATALAAGSKSSKPKKAEKPAVEEPEKEAPPKEETPATEPEKEPTMVDETGSADASLSTSDALASGATPGLATSIVFFDAGIRSDLGTFVRKEIVGRAAVTDDTIDIKNFGPLLHLGFLGHLSDHFRVGGAFGYGMNYTLVERLEKGDESDPDRYTMGQLITADIRLEWNQHLSGPVFLAVTPLVGISMVSVGGDLREATDAVEQSHNVWKGPRLGFLGGANAGVRYMVKDWFSINVGGGWAYNLQSLLRATRKGDAADSKRIWRSTGSRLTGQLALEAHF